MPTRRNMLMTMIAATTALTALPGYFSPASAETDGSALLLIKATTAKLVIIANSGGSAQDMHRDLERIVDSSVDVDGIGRFCLGRFWTDATPDQKRDYLAAFHNLFLTKIANHLGEYRGVTLTVGQARPSAGTEIIASTIERAGAPSTQIDWVVSTAADGNSKIIDLLSSGTSMRQTQTSDFRSYLAQHDYNVQNLIDGLRKLVSVSR